jgi:hypothetical protein
VEEDFLHEESEMLRQPLFESSTHRLSVRDHAGDCADETYELYAIDIIFFEQI